MQIVQAVFGVFHHFELAHQLHRRGHLRKIYSTWPWARLKREGLPHQLVGAFPLLHTTDYLLGRTRFYPRQVSATVNRWNALAFDRYTRRVIPPCDAFIGISGAGLLTGRLVQQRGGKFICDRGSTHQRFQEEVIQEEYKRWKVAHRFVPPHIAIREEKIYSIADAITVPSEVAKRSFVQRGMPEEKVHVIPYGVRLENFRKVADPPSDSFDVLFAGQISLRKGIPYLLQAFAALKHPRKRLRLAGAITSDIRSVLAQLPTGPDVEFIGSVSPAQLAGVMSRSHLLVLPSIEDGYGLVVPQAMACGCPILVSTDAGGSEMITDGVEGFLVPPRGVLEMINRMQQLADEPGLQADLGAAALRRVQSLGGWDAYGDAWESLLLALTAQ